MRYLTETTHYLRRAVTQPIGELSRAQQKLRYSIDLARHCWRALDHDRATEMAAALTYRTIFSMVPVAVVVLILIKAFAGDVGEKLLDTQTQEAVFNFMGLDVFSPSSPDAVELAQPAPGTAPQDVGVDVPPLPGDPQAPQQPATPETGDAAPTPQIARTATGKTTISKELVDEWAGIIAAQISQISFTSIGVVGVLLLIWAALALTITVENCFNVIYNCPTGRPWSQRITVYWSVLTLGPVLVVASLYLKNQVVGDGEGWVGEVWEWVSPAMALAATWLLLFILYALMPNTKVRRQPALIGSFVAAVLWEVAKWGFRLYVTEMLPYSALYGSLALIPLFLLWLYVTWLIILFGLELSYTLQAMAGRKFKYDRDEPREAAATDPRWVVPIVAEVGRWFVKGEPVGQQRLAEELGLPVRSVAELSTKLEEAGLIHRVQAHKDGESGFTLAMPPERLQVRRVLDVAHGLTPRLNRKANQPGWAYLDRLQASLDATAGEQTLAEILDRYDREVEEAVGEGDAAEEDDEGNGSLRVGAKANEPAA